MPGRRHNQCGIERHYGRYDGDASKQVFNIFRTQVDDAANRRWVLNAKEPMLVGMPPCVMGEVIYFSTDPDLAAVERARHGTRGIGSIQGKRAVLVRDKRLSSLLQVSKSRVGKT